MRSAPQNLRSARDPREDILFSELELAVRWNRPSILFAVYDSHEVRQKVSRRLARRLARIGQRVRDFRINPSRADMPLALRDQPGREKTVFMVSGLQQAAEVFKHNPYKSLNIRREILVDSRIRAVFWLTEREAIDLARQAPDFWAFRHRVVEFVSAPHSGADTHIAWYAQAGAPRGSTDDLRAKIAYREQLLAESDEEWPQAYSLRLGLGHLYALVREFDQAHAHLKAAVALASSAGDPVRQADALIVLGGVLAQSGQHDAAAEAFQQAGVLNPRSPVAIMHLSALALTRSQADTACALARQCADQFPNDERAWVHLGWVLGSVGDLAAAASACQRALALNHNNARAWNQLGLIQSMRGEFGQALQSLRQACSLDEGENLYWQSLSAGLAAHGQHKEALTCARRAVRVNPFDSTAWLGLGGTLHTRRRLKDAATCYQRAVELSDHDLSDAVLACTCLSLLWQDKRDTRQAEHWSQKALQHFSASDALGQAACYALCGDTVRASEAILQALALNRWRVHLLRGLPVLLGLPHLGVDDAA